MHSLLAVNRDTVRQEKIAVKISIILQYCYNTAPNHNFNNWCYIPNNSIKTTREKNMLKKIILASAIAAASISSSFAEMVNINKADAETIAKNLKGIGLSKAEAIVKYRKDNGKFKTVDELMNVKGIGEKTIEKNRDDLTVKAKKVSKKPATETDE